MLKMIKTVGLYLIVTDNKQEQVTDTNQLATIDMVYFPEDNKLNLNWIEVTPEARGKGLAQKMYIAALAYYVKMGYNNIPEKITLDDCSDAYCGNLGIKEQKEIDQQRRNLYKHKFQFSYVDGDEVMEVCFDENGIQPYINSLCENLDVNAISFEPIKVWRRMFDKTDYQDITLEIKRAFTKQPVPIRICPARTCKKRAFNETGGGKPNSGKTKTKERIQTPKGPRTVYVGPRGGKYVKIAGAFVNIRLFR